MYGEEPRYNKASLSQTYFFASPALGLPLYMIFYRRFGNAAFFRVQNYTPLKS